ncbi:MAG TPA: class I SAM-dependent methyltransferase [Acidimicrobiales bacterium]|nr:class I SAM-dependent methyltransferase [Acidimicrobiales bacterium]
MTGPPRTTEEGDGDGTDRLLAAQRTYYDRRAPHYDQWWERRGLYDRGEEENRAWQEEIAMVERALGDFGVTGDVLELAGGTGWWTSRLARTARSLTVVDASPQALKRNRRRTGRPDVTYVEADLFSWTPERRYHVVFFSFWLSHVPRGRVDAFFDLVAASLDPTGRVFLVDNRLDPDGGRPDPYVIEYGSDVQRRRLPDGSEHPVVKVHYEPPDLVALLEGRGWTAQADGTRRLVWASTLAGSAP